MYKKVCCKCKVVVLSMFSLPIVLSDLKVPNRNCGTYMCQDNYSSSCKYDWPCNDCTIKRNCIKRSLAWSVNSPFFFATQPVSKKKIQNRQWHKFTVKLQSNVSLTIDKNYSPLVTDFQFQQDQIESSWHLQTEIIVKNVITSVVYLFVENRFCLASITWLLTIVAAFSWTKIENNKTILMHSFQAGNIYEFSQVKNLSTNIESPNIQLVQTMDYPLIIH